MEKNYFASVELGSLYNNILVLSYHKEKLDVVASCKCKSNGFLNGQVMDEDLLINSLKNALSEINQKYKISIDEVIVVLPNNNHKVYSALFSNRVLTERQIIGKSQIDAIRKQIRNAKVGDNEVLVDEVPTSYTLDGDRVLRTPPINYQSSILSIRSNVHTLSKNNYNSIIGVLQACKLEILDNFINCHCGVVSTVDEFDLEGESIHISISDDSTTLSAFKKNVLIKSMNLKFSVNTLVNHLANTLKIDSNEALDLFERYFICNIEYASDVIFDEDNKLSERRISGIILNRLFNGFKEINDAIKTLVEEVKFDLSCKYILTGWMNDFEYFIEEFSNYTDLKFIDGRLNKIGIVDQSFINCYGAIKLFVKNNIELVLERLENDSETTTVELSNENADSVSTLNEKPGKFKDIFDD